VGQSVFPVDGHVIIKSNCSDSQFILSVVYTFGRDPNYMSWGFVGSISISLKAESASNQELDVSLFLEPSSFFASWDYVDDYMCTALSPSAEPSTSSAEPTPSRCFVCLFSLVISTLVTGLLTIASLTEGNQRFGF
jgi:hypothetical protein